MESDDRGWDRNDPDAWFTHEFSPQSTMVDYISARPRGMTNPPMNLALRSDLCKELVENDIDLVAPEWSRLSMRNTASAPTTPSQLLQRHIGRSAASRAQMTSGYLEHLRSGRVLKKGDIFSRSDPNFRRAKVAEEIPPLHPSWHIYHPSPHALQPIARNLPRARGIPTEKEKRAVHFADSPSKKALTETLAAGGGAGQKCEYMKTPSHDKALSLGKRLSLVADTSGKRQTMKDFGKDSAKDEDSKANSKPTKKVEEPELENGIRVLRGMSQLHRAAVADRFRFNSNASVGQPMVLGGATLNSSNPGKWYTDISDLQKFHNSAIRIVDPSGLDVLKEPQEKKKKKKPKVDEIDDLKMSDSGLFVARYPIDESLKVLRRIRKSAFPEEAPVQKGPTQEEIARKAAIAKLKIDLSGALLGKIRSQGISEDEQQEMNDCAVRASQIKLGH